MIINPIKYYNNAGLSKKEILNDNQKKSGIYLWTNNLNNNSYVGSAINLSKRLGTYFNDK